MNIKRGVAICHYNRSNQLSEIVEAVYKTVPKNTKIVVCDDGSKEAAFQDFIHDYNGLVIIGKNRGVAANKNRALWALQDCHFLCILEDDLKPIREGWFETYEQAAAISGIHHFCRVQDKEVTSMANNFDIFMASKNFNCVYGPSPRGDLTFISSEVLRKVGGFNRRFIGAGYAHGEWSNRVFASGLIAHPNKWIDILYSRDSFVQIGDTYGGRWEEDKETIDTQLKRNKKIYDKLKQNPYIYHQLVLE